MSEFLQVTAVILAGGLGTRLSKVVSDRPKVMAEINGNPFLCYLLDQLAQTDIERVIISTGYMAGKIEKIVGSAHKGIQVDYSREKNPLGTGGALKLAGQAIGTKYCLVMNGDSYTEFDLISLLMTHKQSDASISMVIKAVKDSSRYGTIHMDGRNNITKFTEKGGTSGQGLINAGVYLMNKSVLKKVPLHIPCSLERHFFPKMVGNGIYGYETKEKFIDIGTPESYAEAEKFFNQPPIPN